jgi:hypothetical protein
MADLLEVVEPGVVLARDSCIVGFYAFVPPSMAYVRRHREISDDMLRRYERWAYIHVVDLSRAPKITFSADVREGMIASMRRYDHVVPAVAVVFLGGGFTAAAVRAIGTSMLLVARMKGSYKFVSSVEAGISHVRAHADRIHPAFPSAERIGKLIEDMGHAAQKTA